MASPNTPVIVGSGRRVLDGLPSMRLESIAGVTSPRSYLVADYRPVS
jgi:hypothetical protein